MLSQGRRIKSRSAMLIIAILSLTGAHIHGASSASGYREVDMPNGWKEIFPGGQTTCGRGDEFSFFYREGNGGDVIIDFGGGGACWSYRTCQKGGALFVDSIDYLKDQIAEEGFRGIHDHANDNNPLKAWSHVVIPYCTGDLHWGDNVHTYAQGDARVTIFHKGAVNAKTVLDWSFEQQNPQRILVTGTSAGGYASLYWLPYIKEHQPDAAIMQFSDGAAGVIVKERYREALRAWNGQQHAPAWIPNLDPRRVTWYELSMADFYIEIGRYYPTIMLSQFNTVLDSVQRFFYSVMGGDATQWMTKALESMNLISQSIENFQYFHADGDEHTVIADNEFYIVAANDVKLVDWVQNMIDRSNMGNIVCDECEVSSISLPSLSSGFNAKILN